MDIRSLVLANPKTIIIIISFLATLVVTTLTHFLTNKTLMREIKEKQKSDE